MNVYRRFQFTNILEATQLPVQSTICNSRCRHRMEHGNLPLLSEQTFRRNKSYLLSTMSYHQYAHYTVSSKSTVVSRKRKGQHSSVAPQMKCFVHQENEFLLEQLKEQLKGKLKNSYILNQAVAKKMVSAVMKHRSNPTAPVLEIQAGTGLVSQEFLRQKVSKVIGLETNKTFHPFLTLSTSMSDRRVQAYRRLESIVVEQLQSQSSRGIEGKPYSLFVLGGETENNDFLFYIIRNLPNGDVILSQPGTEFFFLVHPKFKAGVEYLSRISEETKSPTSIYSTHIIAYLLYDIKFLEEFNADDFWTPFSERKSIRDQLMDTTKRHLVRMQLKTTGDNLLPMEHHLAFMFFLKQLYRKKTLRVIPAMESLVPGCGLKLLVEGFTMLDIVQSVRPELFLSLFKIMQTWPEYASSSLREHILMRTKGSLDEDIVGIVDPLELHD